MARTQLFISYAREDNRMRLRVVGHLKVLARAGLIDIWDDGRLEGGDNWRAEINDAMGRARIALLLISAPFLTSDFILKKEIPRLFRRHEADGMTIYPLLIRYCSWEQVRWLKRMQIRPENERPVADFDGNKIDKILTEVAREIARMAKQASRKSGKRATKKRAARKSAQRAARKSRTSKSKTVPSRAGKKARRRTQKKVSRTREARTRVSGRARVGGRKAARQGVSKRAKPK
jgi:hypothetical protein